MGFNWFRRQFDEDGKEKPESIPEAKVAESPVEPKSEVPATPQASTATDAQDLLNWAKAAYVNIQKQQTPQVQAREEPTAPIAEDVSESKAEETPTIAAPSEAVGASPETSVAALPQPESTPIIGESELPEPVLESAPVLTTDSVEKTITPEEITEALVVRADEFVDEVISVEEITEPIVEITESSVTQADEIADEITDAIAEIKVVDETQSEAPVSLPFWAQSEADRQARIAALAANAIVELEPQTTPPSVAEVAETSPLAEPEIPFDEGFLWSAEILAAQGRRPEDISAEEITWLKRLRQGLDKTRLSLVNQLKALVGQGPLAADAVDDIEAILLQADVGVQATDRIVQALQAKLRNEVLPPEAAIAFLKQILRDMLDIPLSSPNHKFATTFAPEKNQLNVWLITGVNGAGKTTTIGKIAHIAKKSGYSTLIAAADTFRAAAVQQVKVWGDRAQVDVIANTGKNTDPAAVVFDAIIAAQARGTELLLVDTAGRLQNKKNLMDELSKIRRIVDKKAAEATVESLLVLDATLGQNGLRQAEVFSQSAGVSGVVLTKLDGTAKGGVALAVVQQLGLPIRFIGAGEGIEDLRPFSSYEFVEALLSN